MRGVGGLLFNVSGSRFCNEVSTRANVTHNMLLHDEVYASTGVWERGRDIPDIWMVLGQEAGAEAGRHVDLYTHKGLLTEVAGLKGVAKHTGMPEAALKATYRAYAKASKAGVDPYGKTVFRNLPSNVKGGKFYVGKVTPVLHYCMGGLKIDSEGNVMTEGGGAIPGLYAAGEVTGGVHGANRLGGNSLLECTVFGRRVGERVKIKDRMTAGGGVGELGEGGEETGRRRKVMNISKEDLAKHTNKDSCWVAIHGNVYDLTEFAVEHPPGAESIWELCGTEATEVFKAVHSEGMLDDFADEKLGIYVA